MASGFYVGRHGCEQLVKRFWSNFTPHNRWGKDHRDLLAQFWNPSGWTLDNATYFGAPISWLTQPEPERYNKQVSDRKPNGPLKKKTS